MKHSTSISVLLIVAALSGLASMPGVASAAGVNSAAGVASARGVASADGSDPDTRASAAVAQMSDAELIQLLHGVMAIPLPIPGYRQPPEGLKITAGYIKGIARLGVPDIWETDASLGVVNPGQSRRGDVATAMPAGLALAASFDPDLAFRGGAMMGGEARAKGFNVLLGGGSNLARDPRNGRNFEYLGEDPLLAGTLAGEQVRGTQSQHVVSTVKHFALNDQETLRHTVDVVITEAAERESDLLAFEIAVERGQPGSVMCSYNLVAGDYACGNDALLNRILKGDWGFKGWVMSDWGAVYDVSFLVKGLDQESGEQLDRQVYFDQPLQARVQSGAIPKSRVSDAAHRIVRSLFAVGVDAAPSEASIDYPRDALVAHQAAAEGMVLLKNDGILPLGAASKKIAVFGGHADAGVLSGGGSSQVTPYGGPPAFVPLGGEGLAGFFGRELFMPSSPVKHLRSALPGASVSYYTGYDLGSAAAAAAGNDAVIVFATQWQTEDSDHASMNLPEGQDALIATLAKANPNVIVVLETGNPVKMPWLADVKAVIEAWYPGQEGGAAIAELLAGTLNPSGHLPISFPTDESQLPRPTIPGLGLPDGTGIKIDYFEGSDVGYRWYAAKHLQPLFPFGHGLSYTRFEFTQLRLSRAADPKATFTVKNVGAREGAAVPQLYLLSAAGKPVQRLAAFSRVVLAPGSSQTVSVSIDPRLLAHWDTAQHRWQRDSGKYEFALGASAADLGERAGVELRAQTLKP